jgi:hypothetical protein
VGLAQAIVGMIILANPSVYPFKSLLRIGRVEALDDICCIPDHQFHRILA